MREDFAMMVILSLEAKQYLNPFWTLFGYLIIWTSRREAAKLPHKLLFFIGNISALQ
jgi:uncharacterized Tic20 family protein